MKTCTFCGKLVNIVVSRVYDGQRLRVERRLAVHWDPGLSKDGAAPLPTDNCCLGSGFIL